MARHGELCQDCKEGSARATVPAASLGQDEDGSTGQVKREAEEDWGKGEMAITQGKMPFVFGMVVLATLLIAAPLAHAACRSPKNICKHLDDCLQRTSDPNNKDADGIRAA